ncbi:MAG: hypothetical protein ACT6S0_20255 [Roseateles sp.]|uniref:hypothetical protein n=1 Tax=Roseateles sp. TaxID=1971397 RepID=UPI0040356F27
MALKLQPRGKQALSLMAGSLRSALPRAWRNCVAGLWAWRHEPGMRSTQVRRAAAPARLSVHQQLFPVGIGTRTGFHADQQRGVEFVQLDARRGWPNQLRRAASQQRRIGPACIRYAERPVPGLKLPAGVQQLG